MPSHDPVNADGVPVLGRRDFLAGATAAGAFALLAGGCATSPIVLAGSGRQSVPFDSGWRFFRGDMMGADRSGFDDTSWRVVDLPHDWSIEDAPGAEAAPASWVAPSAIWNETARGALEPGQYLPVPKKPDARSTPAPLKVGPFDGPASPGGFYSGWTLGGVGWYRNQFSTASLPVDAHVALCFDGSFNQTEVWVNGVRLGTHVNGFLSFAFDLTPHLVKGENSVAVCVKNEGVGSRWYAGSGIYRHVWLDVSGPVRTPRWGVSITTPEVATTSARVNISADVENRSDAARPVDVSVSINNARGEPIATATQTLSLEAGVTGRAVLDLTVGNPDLWSPASSSLYTADVALMSSGQVLDRTRYSFGIRKVEIDSVNGLRINGTAYKLKGACIHHDNGLLGARAIDRAEVRKVELLKANGFNAIRGSHNAYSPAFLDACDRLGMLVIAEAFDCWEQAKTPQDYARFFPDHWREDWAAMIHRDRNHPSIIMWSIGNEIPERDSPRGVEVARMLSEETRRLDPTRPVTAALPPGPTPGTAPRSLDVVGYNYMSGNYERDRAANPGLIIYGSEQFASDIHDAWRLVEKHPWVIGDFVWTGIDYIGEVGAGSSQLRPVGEATPPQPLPFTIFLWDYPAFQSGCGEIDLLGLKKPQSYYRDVLWGRSKLALFVQRPVPEGMKLETGNWGWHDELPSWTWPVSAETALTVRAYTIGDEVRLLLNGKQIASKVITAADKLTAEFQAPYAPGELVAVSLSRGVEIARATLTTAGAPSRVRLRTEHAKIGATRGDLAYVFAEVVDAEGRPIPDAAVHLTFSVSGPAELAGAGSANPRGIESFQDPHCRTFHGVALAIVRPLGQPGRATVRVVSPDLAGDSAAIEMA